jgi:hypothetical protein
MFAVAGRVRALPSKALTVACGGAHTACIAGRAVLTRVTHSHTCARLVDGLYMWGLNHEGQLGFPSKEASHVAVPRLISTPKVRECNLSLCVCVCVCVCVFTMVDMCVHVL